MNLIKLIIIWFCASECLAKIFEVTSKISEPTSLVEATVDILSSCYVKEVNIVGHAGIFDDIIFKKLCSKQFIQLVLIGNDTNDAPVDKKLRQKLQIFIVTVDSSPQLEFALKQIKRSQWWNHMGIFFIFDWDSIKDHGCSNAFTYLWKAWNNNILNAIYLCRDQTKGRMIYTFNPFTSQAPNPWQWENTFRDKNDHPWTLLRREYDGDKEICMNLQFDKTSNLNGYKIDSSVKESPLSFIIDHNKTSRFSGPWGFFIQTIFQALNATPHLIVHDQRIPGLNDKMGNDMSMDTVNGISDVLLHARIHLVVINYTVSQFCFESHLGILTQYSGHQSQLSKLLHVIDLSSRIGLCLVIVITVIFFKLFLHQPIVIAFLNIFRIITNSTLTKIPNNQAARFYLAGIFFLVVTIVGIYQGKLASLLTKSRKLPNVETIQDLADRGYTIHGHKTYAYLFTDPIFKGSFIEHESYDCAQYVVRDRSAACVQQKLYLIDAAVKYKLHLARYPATKTSAVFVIRKDWPLEMRFNTIIAALTESYTTLRILEKKATKALSIAKFYENEDEKEKFKIIVLGELTFAFIILGIGLGCAAVCFLVEIVVSQYR